MPKYTNDKTPEQEGFLAFSKYFKFVKNLGSGTFGKVVLATDIQTGEEVAVKVSFEFPFYICIDDFENWNSKETEIITDN